jgi:hypothetical protein
MGLVGLLLLLLSLRLVQLQGRVAVSLRAEPGAGWGRVLMLAGKLG